MVQILIDPRRILLGRRIRGARIDPEDLPYPPGKSIPDVRRTGINQVRQALEKMATSLARRGVADSLRGGMTSKVTAEAADLNTPQRGVSVQETSVFGTLRIG